MGRQADIAGALDRLAEAPYAEDQWQEALRLLAAATGSCFSQYIGWTHPGRLPLNLTWNEPDGMVARWVALGGTDPDINPVVRTGLRTPELRLVSDNEIISRDARRRLPIWQDIYEAYDLPHLCFTPIWRDGLDPRCHLSLAVCRNSRAGVITPADRAAFAAIAPRWREASLLAQAVGRESGKVLAGAFDALSASAVALEGFGRIVGVSQAAEALLRRRAGDQRAPRAPQRRHRRRRARAGPGAGAVPHPAATRRAGAGRRRAARQRPDAAHPGLRFAAPPFRRRLLRQHAGGDRGSSGRGAMP